jgi:hypothetical protein
MFLISKAELFLFYYQREYKWSVPKNWKKIEIEEKHRNMKRKNILEGLSREFLR